MKNFLLYILLSLGANLIGQQIESEEYFAITKTILSNREIRENLIKYSRFDSHPIYDTNQVFILDTLRVDKEWIVIDNYPKFIITNAFNIKSGFVNYWLCPTEIIADGNKLRYVFKTQSIKWQDSTEYIQGEFILKKERDIWIIYKFNITPYNYIEPRDIECYEKTIPCSTKLNRPKKSQIDNPFYGDWQFLHNSTYYEVFFTDDTIFSYKKVGVYSPFGLKYELNDTLLTINSYFDSTAVKLKYKLINKKTIIIYSDEELEYNPDRLSAPANYSMRKIRSSDFKYSDVRCWGEKSIKYGCIIDSQDAAKYYKAFWERMFRFKLENEVIY